MSEMTKNMMTAGSFAEVVIEKLSPLSWDETAGRLRLDEERLQEKGLKYAGLYAQLAIALLCLAFLVVDLSVAGSLTAKLFGVLSVTGAAALLYGAARTWVLSRQLS
jgi:hypothetical protein